jgi:hypothetical protein
MNKFLSYLAITLLVNLNSYSFLDLLGSTPGSINDGPYIFNMHDTIKVKWIENNILTEKNITPETFSEIKNKFNLLCNYKDLTDVNLIKPIFNQNYNRVDSIAVITDIHGEYNTYINLLKATGIIDRNLNWNFGKGHLVVLGDSFDRGDMVTEVLWHLFGLEKQASAAGGMIHVLLGNHEVMVLDKNESYINEKYKKVELIADIKYYDLYSEKSVLGKWLRSKPVMLTLNKIIFVHGGISIELVRRNLNVRQINQDFSGKIVGKDVEAAKGDAEVELLNDDNGPLWYRGYFADKGLSESRLDSILDFYHKEHIVVGHTTSNEIRSFFNNKIIAVDAGIMNEQPGEMLIIKNGIFYKGYSTGDRIKL